MASIPMIERVSARRRARTALLVTVLGVALLTASCGGGAGGAEAGRGLVLLSFLQDGVDNVPLNTVLQFEFSEAVDIDTISPASVQIREGDAFGLNVPGIFRTLGSTLRFEPQLPGLCDLSDAAFKADTQYRVQVIGSPEEFAVRNQFGQPLDRTTTHEFHTRLDTDPEKFVDGIPATSPEVTNASPVNGDAAVAVADGNQVVLDISENLDPCTVSDATVRFEIYERGGQLIQVDMGDGRKSGFSSDGTDLGDPADQRPGDLFTWGATGSSSVSPPQKILATIELMQDFQGTQIVITPLSGRFPENALIVVQISFDITDFGGSPMVPFAMSFTTENLPPQSGTYVVENEGETPYDKGLTTADVNTARAPSLLQGYLLFAGDGDNGADLNKPTKPQDNAPLCTTDYQSNDANPDEYAPTSDELLDTGSSVNECDNDTDGSRAVVFEFNSFRIPNGVTVRVVGVNPAIILVLGEVLIENGGTLLVRGDGQNGAPDSRGKKGRDVARVSDQVNPGGVGVAGGGNGGDATRVENNNQNWKYGHDGNAGVGSPDYDPTMPAIDPNPPNNDATPTGGGQGGAPVGVSTSSPWDGGSEAGGGGGHATAGTDGQYSHGNPTNWVLKLPRRAKGGTTYEVDASGSMPTPEAGSGGGASGQAKDQPWRSSTSEGAGGASGGAGGGFVDLTSNGDINIFGTIDAAGSRGGDGIPWNGGNGDRGITGGAGGGSGGGIRLLTANSIVVTSSTVITTAGGVGGTGAKPYSVNTRSNGGAGGNGRVAFEDSDSIIAGLAGATIIPGEGEAGFYRSVFNAARFQGGGLTPKAVTEIFPIGPFDPMFDDPVQVPGGQEDFVAGVPPGTSNGTGKTVLMIEIKGYEILPDGLPDETGVLAPPTDWHTVGYFTDSGVDTLPTWNLGNPPLAEIGGNLPTGNFGVAGIANVDGREFVQLRVSMFLNANMGATDPGPYLDRWIIHFTSDQ